MVLRNVHNHVNLLVVEHVDSLWLLILRRPEHFLTLDALLGEVLVSTACCEELITVLVEFLGCIKHLCFLLCITRREQDCLLRNT